jgi:porin
MGLKVDLSKFSGWRGATIFISGVNRDGTGLTINYVKSQYNSQQTVGGQSLFFYQLFLRQQLADGKVTLKLGRFAASDDLNESPIYSRYLNNGFNGDIRNVLFDTQFSAYPFATYAALVQLHPNTKFNFQIGVYQTWNDIFHSSTNGVDWRIRSSDGAIFMEQAGWTPKDGHYWVGSTYSPWKGFTQFGSTQRVANSYGFYAHGDQTIYRGLTVGAASGYHPQQKISIVPFQVSTGVIYQGLIPNRPKDRAIFGFIYGQFSRDYAHTQIAQAKGNPSHEMVLEIGYRFRLSKFFFFQPDLQGSLRPAGTRSIPNALVAGAEMGIVF